jgi:hypothetical protein
MRPMRCLINARRQLRSRQGTGYMLDLILVAIGIGGLIYLAYYYRRR